MNKIIKLDKKKKEYCLNGQRLVKLIDAMKRVDCYFEDQKTVIFGDENGKGKTKLRSVSK